MPPKFTGIHPFIPLALFPLANIVSQVPRHRIQPHPLLQLSQLPQMLWLHTREILRGRALPSQGGLSAELL